MAEQFFCLQAYIAIAFIRLGEGFRQRARRNVTSPFLFKNRKRGGNGQSPAKCRQVGDRQNPGTILLLLQLNSEIARPVIAFAHGRQ